MSLTSVLFAIIQSVLILTILTSFSLTASAQRRREQREQRQQRQQGQRKNRDKQIKLEDLPAAFAPSWQFASESTMRLPALAEDDAVYLPLSDGRVVALDAENGELRWETQPGGVIVTPLASLTKTILIASRQGTIDSTEGGGLLRAVNKQSGVTLWSKEFLKPFSTPLVIDQQIIYAASQDQNFYALNVETGTPIWSAPLGSLAYARPTILDQDLFIGTEAGLLFTLSRTDGKVRWQFQADGALRGAATANSEYVYVGDSLGHVYCLERNSGKLRWRVRTGAAIESAPTIADKLLLVASFDNFVYALNANSGDRVWKSRLPGRLSFDPLLQGQHTIIAPLRGRRLFLLSLTGRVLGQFQINTGEIIAPPALEQTRLFIVTDEGLVAAHAQELDKTEKAKKP
ncbi:MAG: PQQ-binding-like beta-propeller repeat protein [Acidobacteriota bacterium]